MFTEPYLATVTIFAGNFAPRGWMLCNGQLLSIAQNDALYALIGTTYGGDGQVTFALPDLRGRAAIHTGQGIGLSNHVLGEQAGTESATPLVSQMPAHSHSYISTTGSPGASSAEGIAATPPTNNVPATIANVQAYDSAGASSLLQSPVVATTVSAGSSQPVPLLSPFLAMNYIIAVEGIFPSRN